MNVDGEQVDADTSGTMKHGTAELLLCAETKQVWRSVSATISVHIFGQSAERMGGWRDEGKRVWSRDNKYNRNNNDLTKGKTKKRFHTSLQPKGGPLGIQLLTCKLGSIIERSVSLKPFITPRVIILSYF